MHNKSLKKYKKFTNDNEVEAWAQTYYSTLLNSLPGSNEYDAIFGYSGSWYKLINELARIGPLVGTDEFDKCDFKNYEEEKQAITTLNSVLRKYATPHPIVAYRATKFAHIKSMSKKYFLRRGLLFSDKGFASTSLFWKEAFKHAINNGYNCILKIYIPEGCPGAYISFKTNKTYLDEKEFLLPPNVMMKILKIHNFLFFKKIDCIVVLDNEDDIRHA